uniref:Uncharacterized protein n=1 Tax=Morchella importuna TaxID=1174673 RepID=A0A650AFJ6_9PEZI|nr:hypothetical protein [Morchella importuna]QGN66767.1 hypothetical protein [Morchella importuna]
MSAPPLSRTAFSHGLRPREKFFQKNWERGGLLEPEYNLAKDTTSPMLGRKLVSFAARVIQKLRWVHQSVPSLGERGDAALLFFFFKEKGRSVEHTRYQLNLQCHFLDLIV